MNDAMKNRYTEYLIPQLINYKYVCIKTQKIQLMSKLMKQNERKMVVAN